MPRSVKSYRKKRRPPSFHKLIQPVLNMHHKIPALESKGDRPLKMSFEDQLNALIFYHLEEHTSGRHLIQVLKEDNFARNNITPKDGIEKSSFFEAINNRGLKQLRFVYAKFDSLQAEGKHFVIRIKANTTKTVVREYDVNADSIVFYDAEVLLGTTQNNNQTQKSIRLVGYRVDKVDYWVATDRRDLAAELNSCRTKITCCNAR